MDPGTEIAEEVAPMFTQLIAPCRFGSALRTLTFALLLSGAVAPAAFADHVGIHQRSQVVQTTSDCSSATEDGSGTSSEAMPLVADPTAGSGIDAPDDTVPVHPFSGHPW